MTFIVMTADAMSRIVSSDAVGGDLHLRYSKADDLYLIRSVEIATHYSTTADPPRPFTALRDLSGPDVKGQWLANVALEVAIWHHQSLHRPGTSISFEDFNDLVTDLRRPKPGRNFPLVTHHPDLIEELRQMGASEFLGWDVSLEGVTPLTLATEPRTVGLAQVEKHWPIDQLADMRVGVLAVGSIGGVIADDLAGYGIGTLDLIDPDRFEWHNEVRHVLGKESVGRYKVDAMKQRLESRWPNLTVNTFPVDFAAEAHHMRRLLAGLNAVVCSTDGIAARRVVSHLARQARIPAVLACVLGDGTIGEVLRLRPGRAFGCLLCHRAHLADIGAMDIEVMQELDYGTGTTHKPMTAIGPDLWGVGHLAAKVTLATLLESQTGDRAHRLSGDLAVLGLRPIDPHPAPYDVDVAGELRWHPIPGPRPDCPTCSTA